MKKSLLALAAVAAATLAAVPAEARVRAGTLTCQVAPGVGLIVGSQRTLECQFKSRRLRERYTGQVNRIGLDIGFTSGQQVVWAVFASARPGRGALAGNYVGATAEVSLAAGLGANALVGGFRRSIALQPLSVGTQTGVNLAVAVTGLDLEYAGRRH
ncbi:DUF992 domain-containing protein [Pseudolabrys taiwanensis]|uniref:DUF992 domain-containing protein n=1 Tax=Pseudolabrys taiwanensis TaxID=331696 RepID=A0A345ZRF9_9HYPH|nr:DUF992 domain-containing protein [Pseudolabrys taiwanensis]AXK79506.1 DUF992 domain-containing protein [Pseudolabrys taiwanensis]